MQLPSYQTQFNKITEAYIKGELDPVDSNFCFCGTLSPTRGKWNAISGFSYGYIIPEYITHQYDHPQPYTLGEYKRMEWALIHTKNGTFGTKEDCIFNGLCAALEVLKQIHIERGEVIDEEPVFKKRVKHGHFHSTDQML